MFLDIVTHIDSNTHSNTIIRTTTTDIVPMGLHAERNLQCLLCNVEVLTCNLWC